tara:strand:- start:1321 stop:1599 length:279 start_codon:yes stop_codon:yes gene_type:complete
MTLTELDIRMCRSKLITKGISDPTNDQIAMRFVRDHRNGLLKNSDWMGNSDVTMSSEWQIYRQALRDLPANAKPKLDNNGQLTGVTWPTKPK